MGDQLDDYRLRMQERYNRNYGKTDEILARELQEEENRKAKKQAETDEEIARKLQEQEKREDSAYYPQAYPSSGGLPQANPQPYYGTPSNQPYYGSPLNQPVYNQNTYPPPPPPPSSYYASNPYAYQAPRAQESRPLVPRREESFLPEVNDKCCGLNTQTAVLTISALMIIGIIAATITFAVI